MIIFYCLIIVIVSLLGGSLPLLIKIQHRNMQFYLSLSAGAMLGAAFFDLLPEAAKLAGSSFGFWAIFGVIGLYFIERFLSPHSHDTQHEILDSRINHFHPSETLSNAAPAIAGWSAVGGLAIHTILGGIALGSAVFNPQTRWSTGLSVFLATLLHKPADAFTISVLLQKGLYSHKTIFLTQVLFASLIPLGVILFTFGQELFYINLEQKFTGSVMAFSAGTFLCIALSDLLPEVQFHTHDRIGLFIAVLAGASIMYGASILE